MISVDLTGQIRRAYFEQGRPIKEIVRTLSVSRATVRKVIRGEDTTEFRYTARAAQPSPKLGPWIKDLVEILEAQAKLPRREWRSTQRLFETLRGRGYEGAHDSVHRGTPRYGAAISGGRRRTPMCLIMADHNRYSVDAPAAGQMVLVRSHAERIVVLFNNEVVASHPRHFRRDQIIYDPWHYLPVLVKKPGVLRNGAPFKDWNLPPELARVWTKLKSHADGDRQFVKALGAVLDHGLDAVEAACAEALEAGIASGDVILTVLARQRQPAVPASITTPAALRLNSEPMADCGRYDSIRILA